MVQDGGFLLPGDWTNLELWSNEIELKNQLFAKVLQENRELVSKTRDRGKVETAETMRWTDQLPNDLGLVSLRVQ